MEFFSTLLVMIVFLLLLLLLAGLVYYFSRGRLQVQRPAVKEGFNTDNISDEGGIYVGFKTYYNYDILDGNEGFYRFDHRGGEGDRWDGDWFTWQPGNNYAGGIEQKILSLSFQPLDNYPNDKLMLQRQYPNARFTNYEFSDGTYSDNKIVLCKYIGVPSELPTLFRNNTDKGGTEYSNSLRTAGYQRFFSHTYRIGNGNWHNYYLVATHWFISNNKKDSVKIYLDNRIDHFAPDSFPSLGIFYYPLDSPNKQRCIDIAKENAMTLRKNITIKNLAPLSITDGASAAIQEPANTSAIKEACKNNILTGDVSITRDNLNIAGCKQILTDLKNNYISYKDFKKFNVCNGVNQSELGTTVEPLVYDPVPQLLTPTTQSTDTGITFTLNASGATFTSAATAGTNKFLYFLQISTNVSEFNSTQTIPFSVNGNPFPLTVTFNDDTKTISLTGSTNFIPESGSIMGYPTNFALYTNVKYRFAINTVRHRTYRLADVTNQQLFDIDERNANNTQTIFTTNDSGFIDRIAPTLFFKYSDTKPNSIQATFNYIDANGQRRSRTLPAGTYKYIFSSISPSPQTIGVIKTTTIPTSYLEFDILTGAASCVTGSTSNSIITTEIAATTPIKETAGENPITVKITDTTGDNTMYEATYTLKQTRYGPATAVPTTGKEVVLLRLDKPQPLSKINDICLAAGGGIATIEQLQAELDASANWHEPGWVNLGADGNGNPVYRTAYPLTQESRMTMYGGSGAVDTKTIVVKGADVSSTNVLVSNVLCYRIKEGDRVNKILTQGTATQVDFNTFTGQWRRADATQNKPLEAYAVKEGSFSGGPATAPIIERIAATLNAVPAVKADLETLARNAPRLFKPVVSDEAQVTQVPNESKRTYTFDATGQLVERVLGENETLPNIFYVYGYKRDAATAGPAAAGLQIIPYNAALNIYSRYDTNQYRTFPYSSADVAAQIEAATNLRRKAALIIQDVQAHPTAFLRRDMSGALNGCELEAIACVPIDETSTSAQKQPRIPIQSRSGRYKIGGTFALQPTNIKDAITDVLVCQSKGGEVPTRDGQFPGCSGECCVPDEGDGIQGAVLDASAFAQTCTPNNAATQCPPQEEADTPIHAPQDAPFRLRRQRTIPPPLKAPTCTEGYLGYIEEVSKKPSILREIQYMYKQQHLAERHLGGGQMPAK